MLPERLRKLPYLVHTNRELGLMLQGVKPLAYFVDVVGSQNECVLRYHRRFDRHVAAGHLIKRVAVENDPRSSRRVCRVLYSLPDQEWRIEAMLALVGLQGPWTRDRERRFGELLGYEGWQNDHWLAHLPATWKI